MKARLIATLLAAATLSAAPAFAHGGMVETSIENNASFAHNPADFKINFEHDSAITSIMLMGKDNKMVALDYKPTKTMGKEFTVPLPQLPAGAYTLSWKSMAKDGHAMPGAVKFTVTGK
jgi:methionine-rich copper-binding protein CopC